MLAIPLSTNARASISAIARAFDSSQQAVIRLRGPELYMQL